MGKFFGQDVTADVKKGLESTAQIRLGRGDVMLIVDKIFPCLEGQFPNGIKHFVDPGGSLNDHVAVDFSARHLIFPRSFLF
jgi:hypothetical protein